MNDLRDQALTGHCKVCGHDFDATGQREAKRMVTVGVCFGCDFLLDLWRMRNAPDVARINGNHYIFGESDSPVRGMSGRTYRISFSDGRQVTTDNLWHQGAIPADWQDLLPNNATFVTN